MRIKNTDVSFTISEMPSRGLHTAMNDLRDHIDLADQVQYMKDDEDTDEQDELVMIDEKKDKPQKICEKKYEIKSFKRP